MAGLVNARRIAWQLSLLGSLCACADHGQAEAWQGTVTHVLDGDTLYVQAVASAQEVAVRLQGIDAPEICQAWGPQSQQALQQALLGQRVTVHDQGPDSYGRALVRLDWQGMDMGRWMVLHGHAWSYRWGQDSGPYAHEERQARAERRGLFSQDRPERPRSFRLRHGSCKTP